MLLFLVKYALRYRSRRRRMLLLLAYTCVFSLFWPPARGRCLSVRFASDNMTHACSVLLIVLYCR